MILPRAGGIECQTAVASDYYGLGVRLGIYFTWLQAYIANTLLASSIPSAADTNTIFLLTLLIAMLNDSVSGTLSQVDGLVLMHLCGGTVFGTLSLWGYRTRLYKDNGPVAVRLFGGYGTHIRMLICLAVSTYGAWFWGWGVTGKLDSMTALTDGVQPPNPSECSVTYTFFFSKLPITGGIRYYYLIVCACCTAWFGAMMLVSGLAGWFCLENLQGSFRKSWADSARADAWSRPRYVTGLKTNELVIMYKVLRVANLAWLIYSIIMVEFTLNFNHIAGVLGGRDGNALSNPGQLLPFLVGLFGFATTLYALVKEKFFPKTVVQLEKTSKGGLLDTARSLSRTSSGDKARGRSLDQQQDKRSLFIRYLVAWMPWLSLLQRFDEELLDHGVSRQGTFLDDRGAVPGSPLHHGA
ncbi:hypothetical protein B0J13DRAFT_677340 [Dactylonectria estremocensis]|uniref:Uncharacterized protein n=1 Tax=Dactylonectria estremocensis TaxID=1079267 RepID=A0A9P9EDB4_9HYPO|nr:hypothetical protein B0J13DRAFT_677340 [Dactylonectria estremocensis]